MKKIIIATMVFLLSVSSALAENRPPGKELLEEIDIMEEVLCRVINGIPLRGFDESGFYLSGYGVIFHVTYQAYTPVFISRKTSGKPEETLVTLMRNSLQSNYRYNEEKKDIVPEIRKSIIKFFTKYAPSISELKSDEKITVIVDLNGFDELPRQVIATMLMSDIEGFKKNKISGDELGKHIVIDEISSIDEDVLIFSNVIQTSLSHMKEDSGFGFLGKVKSNYISGYGISFMVNADFGINTFKLLNKNLAAREKKLKIKEENLKIMERKLEGSGNTEITNYTPASEPQTSDFKEYEEKLIKVISKYGYTLSKIKPGEYIEIAIRFNGIGTKEDFSRGIIKVKKADIDNFNKGKIDFGGFSKKVSVNYY